MLRSAGRAADQLIGDRSTHVHARLPSVSCATYWMTSTRGAPRAARCGKGRLPHPDDHIEEVGRLRLRDVLDQGTRLVRMQPNRLHRAFADDVLSWS